MLWSITCIICYYMRVIQYIRFELQNCVIVFCLCTCNFLGTPCTIPISCVNCVIVFAQITFDSLSQLSQSIFLWEFEVYIHPNLNVKLSLNQGHCVYDICFNSKQPKTFAKGIASTQNICWGNHLLIIGVQIGCPIRHAYKSHILLVGFAHSIE